MVGTKRNCPKGIETLDIRNVLCILAGCFIQRPCCLLKLLIHIFGAALNAGGQKVDHKDTEHDYATDEQKVLERGLTAIIHNTTSKDVSITKREYIKISLRASP